MMTAETSKETSMIKLSFDEKLNEKLLSYISEMGKMISTALSTNWKTEKAKTDFKKKFTMIEKKFKTEFNDSAVKKKRCDNSGCSCNDCVQPKGKRWNAKKFNITIPKTEAPREEVLNFYRRKLDVKELAVGRELHSDGSHHLHVYIQFVAKKNIKSPKYFDLDESFVKYGNIHPNISTLGKKTKESWFNYITMEDKDCISWGFNVWYERLGKLKPKDIAGKLFNGEWKLRDWIKYDPSIMLTKNLKKYTDFLEENVKFANDYCGMNFKVKY